jgi:2-methylfumaryl-CoA hydratase
MPTKQQNTMRTRSVDGYFFEDFVLGATIQHATARTITSGDQSLYIALTGSRFAHHSSAPLARAMGYLNAPIDDLLTFHIAFGKTVADISLNAVANLGYADVRFMSPVYVGDTLSVSSEVIGLKPNSNGKTGVVYVRSTAYIERRGVHRSEPGMPLSEAESLKKIAVSWVRWVMVHLKTPHENAGTSAVDLSANVPKLPSKVEFESMTAQVGINATHFTNITSGGVDRFDDFFEGQVIDHPSGMTIDESEHTLATKLYQNNAKVHFDAHVMQASRFGKRLVYGGHIISICRALSHDGLANAFAIAAINAGTHSNPTFAGDTIYCRTVVIEKYAFADNPTVGALRLKMIGIKNATPKEVSYMAIAAEDERIVLDLDYTALCAK